MYDGFFNGIYNPNMLGFGALMSMDRNANDYFSSLPKEVQLGINEHENEIHSVEELHAYAEKLIKKM